MSPETWEFVRIFALLVPLSQSLWVVFLGGYQSLKIFTWFALELFSLCSN